MSTTSTISASMHGTYGPMQAALGHMQRACAAVCLSVICSGTLQIWNTSCRRSKDMHSNMHACTLHPPNLHLMLHKDMFHVGPEAATLLNAEKPRAEATHTCAPENH